jgi:protein-arginine kinase activator protein McsA
VRYFISLNTLVRKDLEMNFKESSFLDKQINQIELRRQGKNTSKISICRVCGDTALHIHYGGLVCSSCKVFFRRHASYNKVCILFDLFY